MNERAKYPDLTAEEASAVRAALKCPGRVQCKHCIETGGGFDGEWYTCSRCDETYYLDYEEMK